MLRNPLKAPTFASCPEHMKPDASERLRYWSRVRETSWSIPCQDTATWSFMRDPPSCSSCTGGPGRRLPDDYPARAGDKPLRRGGYFLGFSAVGALERAAM